ncbi:hypothetical protein PPL_05476 [Heterostelium album PN500]|uniref:Uncharacterized protein n=1 Tax=Heterostelium pallidum (strain ATCC 26659 / Pp 5 / PN500) TaxID=670386 RepID=D3BAA1_HETP5|nr:hypothetical protein PPL_05476 [Heterostelium album PN500]EFA81488.1 hypothetical protein PPL_05476 [Heterostelium album PN500]|eukprot:XP_020433606.1 hypothetical protein PPL_05476 [Heterostelium album PN500]
MIKINKLYLFLLIQIICSFLIVSARYDNTDDDPDYCCEGYFDDRTNKSVCTSKVYSKSSWYYYHCGSVVSYTNSYDGEALLFETLDTDNFCVNIIYRNKNHFFANESKFLSHINVKPMIFTKVHTNIGHQQQ